MFASCSEIYPLLRTTINIYLKNSKIIAVRVFYCSVGTERNRRK